MYLYFLLQQNLSFFQRLRHKTPLILSRWNQIKHFFELAVKRAVRLSVLTWWWEERNAPTHNNNTDVNNTDNNNDANNKHRYEKKNRAEEIEMNRGEVINRINNLFVLLHTLPGACVYVSVCVCLCSVCVLLCAVCVCACVCAVYLYMCLFVYTCMWPSPGGGGGGAGVWLKKCTFGAQLNLGLQLQIVIKDLIKEQNR